MLAPLLALCALFGLVIPVSRGAEHQVTVGGVGVLKYDPEFVVCLFCCLCLLLDCILTDGIRTRILEILSSSLSSRRTTPSPSHLLTLRALA